METIRWGVLAPGRIARSFATDLALVPDAEIVATGSRSQERAAQFAAEFGGAAYGSYEELVGDPAVDVVYVASPHVLHDEHVRLALGAGKAVLCEKPVTLDAASTAALFEEAAARGLFLMEAMWMACHPMIRKLRSLLADGAHGTARQVRADLGFVVNADPSDRLLDPALGAGALLDMGIYPLTFAQLVLGEPERLTAVAHLSERGIDLDISIAGLYPGGASAALTSSMTSHSPRTASVATEIGRFDLPRDFHSSREIQWTAYWTPEGTTESIGPDEPVIGQGYGNEIAEVHRCLRSGALISELVPPNQTISLMRQMDDVRAQIGVTYPR
ncbi:MAG: oxidoreductase domain protein [Marmoricola sp.]|nr:oxidoreductase domain protein [Marmoricola sp.]